MPAKIGQNTHIVIWGGIVERLEYSVEYSLCEIMHITGFVHFYQFSFYQMLARV